jgi:hypothetical protein
MNAELPHEVIGVRIGNPLLSLRSEFAPAGNAIGCFVLHRMLELALLSDGFTREGCCGVAGGELNDCIFMGQVTDPVAAVETIKRELNQVNLLKHCQIGILEGPVWRCIYPSPGVRMEWLMDTERLEHALAQLLRAEADHLDAIREAVRRLMLEQGREGDGR